MKIRLDIPLLLSEIAAGVNGELIDNDAVISCICTDSREVSRGDLFIALSGDKNDGNRFAGEVKARGGYVLGSNLASILANDTDDAILRLASLYQHRLTGLEHTVAITGSVGKTTTKELTARILSGTYKVHSSFGNFNNSLGLLHTVLSAGRDTSLLVLEMGMNHKGEISRLSRAAEPDVAVITNVGSAHIGNFGSKEAIASAKLEILDGLSTDNLIIPHGEPLLNKCGRFRTASVDSDKGDCSLFIRSTDASCTAFGFYGKNITLENERVALRGAHLMTALALALSVADVLGVPGCDIREALRSVSQADFRQQRFNIGRYKIYDDTYSSSPEAAIAVMRALAQENAGGVSAVLGDMLELGEFSAELHRKVGAAATGCGIRRLYLFGEFAGEIARGASDAGMPQSDIFINETIDDLETTARQIAGSYEGDVLLVKASHAMHAERLYDYLKE